MTQTVVIALLDKAWPPDHSFVTGMLSQVVPMQPDMKVQLLVTRASFSDTRARRYNGAVVIPRLLPRRNIGRFLNFLLAVRSLFLLIIKAKRKGCRITIFVRNDPALLLAGAVVRSSIDRLVFQSSFPHEETASSALKRRVASALYRCSRSAVDTVTAVSPKGIERVSRLFPNAQHGPYIPLLSDLPRHEKYIGIEPPSRSDETRVFIYIGTHHRSRRLEVVLSAIAQAVSDGINAEFRFVGGTDAEVLALSGCAKIRDLLSRGVLSFVSPIPRSEIPKLLSEADIGLSLPPPIPTNVEMSPTKLVEYMGAGLAVLASRGIDLQEEFVLQSGGGLLVDWEIGSIARGIHDLSTIAPSKLSSLKSNSLRYAHEELQYEKFLPAFLCLVV